jgi:metaxin
MPPENEHIPPKAGGPNPAEQNPRPARWPQLGVPKPIATLFSKFPLETLPANPLPATTASGQADNTLYVFTTAGDARAGSPSFNPACLKWQAYLKFAGVGFVTVPSTNHASPSGALPFLIPAMQESSVGASSLDVRLPIPSSKLLKWAQGAGANGKEMEAESLRHEAYLSLIEHRIRDAWVCLSFLSSMAVYPECCAIP